MVHLFSLSPRSPTTADTTSLSFGSSDVDVSFSLSETGAEASATPIGDCVSQILLLRSLFFSDCLILLLVII